MFKFIKKFFLWAKGLDKRLKFLFVGGLNTVLGMGVYFIILLAFGLNLSETNSDKILIKGFATAVSTIVGVINSYLWNKYFTFESKEKTLSEKIKFIAVYAFATGIDLGLKAALSNIEALNEYIIASISIIVMVIINYIGQRYFVFKKAIVENESRKKEIKNIEYCKQKCNPIQNTEAEK